MKPQSFGLKLTYGIGLLGIAGTLLLGMQWQHTSNVQAPIRQHRSGVTDTTLSPLETQWGIRLQGIRLSAAGNLLDFRYRILDADKAQALVDHKSQPYLQNQSNGSRSYVAASPSLGTLRQTSQKTLVNHAYFILFANPGKQIKAGDRVTVAIGNFKAENLLVE